jgi:hypothetical protein
MKRLILATALLASLAACMSSHPSNDGPPRSDASQPAYASPPPPAYTAPAPVYTAPPPAYRSPPPSYMAPVR